MAAGDGNGWVTCPLGHRHWGRHGAAGLLLVRSDPGALRPAPAVRDGVRPLQALMQLRAAWTDAGGTWGLPGGAADSHESATEAALREAHEEAGVDPAAVRVLTEEVTTDHDTWTYTTVVATPVADVRALAANAESQEMTWVALDDVAGLHLHSGFAESWPGLRRRVGDLTDSLTGRSR